jgi:hypothetical protein
MAERKRQVKKVKINKGESCWTYLDECFEEPQGFGFIYLITNNLDGRIYVGKKQFTFRKKTRLSKKARIGTRKRVEITRVDSGWQNYWSSCRPLVEDVKTLGQDKFSRQILMFCKNKSELSYYELYFQIKYEVLLKPSYNGWINAKVYKNKLWQE